MKFLTHSIFAVIVFSCSLTFALSINKEIDITKHVYVKVTFDEAMKSLATAPLAKSADETSDFATILDWQKKRTAAQCATAVKEANVENVADFFGPDYHLLTRAQADALNRIMSAAIAEEIDYIRTLKIRYNRPRPYDANSQIKPCAEKETSKAYPSGHTATTRFLAHVLSAVDPANKAKYFARADEAALLRVIGGVHHPTDIVAGKQFGDYFWQQAQSNPSFNAALAELKKSIAANSAVKK